MAHQQMDILNPDMIPRMRRWTQEQMNEYVQHLFEEVIRPIYVQDDNIARLMRMSLRRVRRDLRHRVDELIISPADIPPREQVEPLPPIHRRHGAGKCLACHK